MLLVVWRLGRVLRTDGGALSTVLGPFKMGLGGVVGSGGQYMSWVALDVVLGDIQHVVVTEALKGPVNAVTPQPVTNSEFTKILGHVLARPTFLPLPSFAARLAFGEMADALLLASTRVEPTRLPESGYAFRYPDLDGARRHLLGKAKAG